MNRAMFLKVLAVSIAFPAPVHKVIGSIAAKTQTGRGPEVQGPDHILCYKIDQDECNACGACVPAAGDCCIEVNENWAYFVDCEHGDPTGTNSQCCHVVEEDTYREAAATCPLKCLYPDYDSCGGK